MNAENNSKHEKRAGKQKKTVLIVIGAVLIFIVLLVLLLPMIISSGPVEKIILSKINKETGPQTRFADLSVSWFNGITITQLTYTDENMTVAVRKISLNPKYSALLVGKVILGDTLIEEPVIEAVVDSSKPKAPSEPSEKEEEREGPVGIPVHKMDLKVSDGRLTVTDVGTDTVQKLNFSSNVNLRPAGETTTFGLSVTGPDDKPQLNADGQVTPSSNDWALEGLSGQIKANADNVDLASFESLFALAGVDFKGSGMLTADINTQIANGNIENLVANIDGSNINAKIPDSNDWIKTDQLAVDITLSSKQDIVNIKQFNIKTDWMNVNAVGTMPTSVSSLQQILDISRDYNLTSEFNVNIAQIASSMPGLLGLQEGMKINSGTLSGSVKTDQRQQIRQLVASVRLADVAGTFDGNDVSLSGPVTADAVIASERQQMVLRSAVIKAPFMNLEAQGNAEQITYKATADIAKAQSEAGRFIKTGQYQFAGQASEQGTIEITDGIYNMTGTAQIINFQITDPNSGVTASDPKITFNWDMTADANSKLLTFKNLAMKFQAGSFAAQNGTVTWQEDAKSPYNMTVLAQSIQLAQLKPYAVLFAGFNEQAGINGTLNSQINVTSENKTVRAYTDNTVIENINITFPGKQPFEQPSMVLNFDLKSSPESMDVSWKLSDTKINIEGDISKKKTPEGTSLNGQAVANYDWLAVTSLAAPYLPADLSLKGQRQDILNFSANVPTDGELLPNLNASARMGFESAGYKGLNLGTTDVNVKVDAGILTIAPFSTAVNTGKLNFAGNADFTKEKTMLSLPQPMRIIQDADITEQMASEMLKYVNPLFANVVGISGVINFQCDEMAIPVQNAQPQDTKVIGTVSVTSLRLRPTGLMSALVQVLGEGAAGQMITIHPTQFRLENGFLRYDKMQVDIGDKPVIFSGVIGLDESLNMKVTIPSVSQVAVPLTGTLKSPKLDVSKLLEGTIRQQLEGELKKGLEGIFK